MAFISKLLKLCKTRAKKSSPDMFNFNVLLAGHYMATDACTTTTCMRKIKPHDYEQKVQKMKDLSKTWVLKGKQFALENGTRRAQIPRKPLDPPISWILTQSLIFQIADPFCVFASTQIYKRPFLWSSCDSVQQWCRRETPEMKIVGWIPGENEIL